MEGRPYLQLIQYCHGACPLYSSGLMTKAKRVFRILGLVAAAVLVTGCSGVNYTHGVSPATFLLPGLVNNEEPAPAATEIPEQTDVLLVHQNS